MTHLINILKGAVIGVANAIPGVSGGTMAVILNIYDRLLASLTLNLKKLKENFWFLFTIVLGAGIGILSTAKLLDYLFKHHNVPTQFFFMGVILGSIPMIYKTTTSNGKIKPINIVPFLLGLGVMIAMAFINEGSIGKSFITEITPVSFIYLTISGILGAISMIIPGVSGSLVFKILNVYDTIITAISDFNIILLIPVAIGAIIGILVGAKIISILIKKYTQGIYCCILGLILGSILSIFPREFSLNTEGFISIGIFIIGLALPILMDFKKLFTK